MSVKRKLDTSKLPAQAEQMKQFLESRGQSRAIEAVVRAYAVSLSPLAKLDKPIAIIFCAGPSGVGKTLLAKSIAEFLFGNPQGITKIECGSYTEHHQVSKLIGSPAGYIGYDDTPLLEQARIDLPSYNHLKKVAKNYDKEIAELEEKIAILENGTKKDKNPSEKKKAKELLKTAKEEWGIKTDRWFEGRRHYSVILFDEIEKADPSLYNFLLEIMDEGKVKLMNNQETSFRSSFIFLTSNVGSQEVAREIAEKTMGFHTATTAHPKTQLDSRIYQISMQAIRKRFSSEFIGRLRNIVVFHTLQPKELKRVMEFNTEKALRIAKTIPVDLHITDEAKAFVLQKALDHPELGARLINDKVAKYIEENIGIMLASGEIKPNDRIELGVMDNEIVITKDE